MKRHGLLRKLLSGKMRAPGPRKVERKEKTSSNTNPHEAGNVEVAGMTVDLADPPPTHPVGCCREVKDETVGTEMKQTEVGTNTRVEQSMLLSQTLSEKVLAYAAAVAKRLQKKLMASEEALQPVANENEWLQEERWDTVEEKDCILFLITDKRVSRKHAILEVVGDQLRIKPVHVNPCFYQSPENSHLLPLETDEWHALSPGDSFSLLIDKYIFKVLSTHSDVESTLSCNESEELKPVWRKRMLPSWMLQGDLVVQSLSTPVTKRGGGVTRGKGRGKNDMEPSKSRANVQGRKRLACEERLGDFKEMGQDQGKKSKTTEEEATGPPSRGRAETLQQQAASGTDVGPQHAGNLPEPCCAAGWELPAGASGIPLSRNDDKTVSQKIESSVEKSDCQLHSKRPDHRLDAKSQLSTDTNKMNERENKYEDPEAEDFNSARSTDALQSSKQTKQKRTPCMYGTGCYRKNPVHFQQFSHPGDRDYHDVAVVSQDDDDDRPECPYGTTCYRKNPQHKLEYKHTAPPGKSVLEEDSDNDGEPNEYDLNDSFLDDEEKEEYDPTDEDSDWEPDPEDKDNEDVETLLKEAQKFIKTKK
ncbi:Aprataxin and PNK-like factor [Chelonia mydas]|uniref:Aprataxin and PNK-like factor n=1 Tax=Chelonia mydas TaxID=8469 RepID=M7B3V9_CHEMY|nr:Aprataxin and PNK-like factor [Chelonia mydas]